MNKRARLNLLLALPLAVLIGYLICTTPREPLPGGAANASGAMESVQRIDLIRDARPNIRFVRTASGWEIVHPVRKPANPVRIQAMLDLLDDPGYARLDAASLDPAVFGLASPAVTLVFDDRYFHFGAKNPFDKGRYVRHRDTVFIIRDSLYPQLLQPPAFFILQDSP